MAFTPIAFRICNWRSMRAAVDGGAERAEVVVHADALELHVPAVEQEALVASNSIVRTPNGVT